MIVGNQLPILLISFDNENDRLEDGWESVTNPLDKLSRITRFAGRVLGISYQSS